MGKPRACIATKKIRHAAKSKNLEFLTQNVNFTAQSHLLGRKEYRQSSQLLENQNPETNSRIHTRKKSRSAHSVGLTTESAPCVSNINKTNTSNLISSHNSGNQKPDPFIQKQNTKANKRHGTYSEGQQQTMNSRSDFDCNTSESVNKNRLSSTILDAASSYVHVEPRIDLQSSSSRQQVDSVVMDILMDWTDFDTETVHDDFSYEPLKSTGKTYSRVNAGTDNAEQHKLDLTSQQAGPSTSNVVVCTCGQQGKIDDLSQRNKEQAAQIEKLKQKCKEINVRCHRLTDALNAKILGNPHEDVFTVVEGFTTKDKLKKFSEAGQNSDYIFVKLLMCDLWPAGFSNRSVTGRSSNNPRGRNGNDESDLPERNDAATPKIPLEPNKVSYIQDRLEEHRLYQGDSKAIARVKAKECGRLMTRIIAYYGKKHQASAD